MVKEVKSHNKHLLCGNGLLYISHRIGDFGDGLLLGLAHYIKLYIWACFKKEGQPSDPQVIFFSAEACEIKGVNKFDMQFQSRPF